MTEAMFGVLALLVLAWVVTSDLLARANITGPLFFTVAGFLIGSHDWKHLTVEVDAPSVHLVAEVTLALLLFADAARVDFSRLRQDIYLPGRLLGIGLPLSVVLGSLLAAWLFDDFTWAVAGFVGATLAPTDAALSAQVINDRRIPMRLRRALNVESGLNDGIVTPVVTFTLAVAAGQLGPGEKEGFLADGGALLELAVGLVVGLVIGRGSAKLLVFGLRRRWTSTEARGLATLAAALGSFAIALTLSGNGFIAAFVAGLAFRAGLGGALLDTEGTDGTAAADDVVELPELLGEILAFVVWFLFGAALVPIAIDNFDLPLLAYAVLSLTVVRIVPVAASLVGKGLDGRTVLFLGWFGPRGLASVVFALLAIEELGTTGSVQPAIAAVALTVLMSVVLHGVSAGPLGGWYVRHEQAHDDSGPGPRSRRPAHRQLGRR
ncbi:cation:proton antiporter [Kribbella sp. NPDC051936]|uniref:cation:proton antiporter n=1 Tax=Kribbella sp. NPDC051936 TaxID=3154946 RepID=UPI003442140C